MIKIGSGYAPMLLGLSTLFFFLVRLFYSLIPIIIPYYSSIILFFLNLFVTKLRSWMGFCEPFENVISLEHRSWRSFLPLGYSELATTAAIILWDSASALYDNWQSLDSPTASKASILLYHSIVHVAISYTKFEPCSEWTNLTLLFRNYSLL